MCMGKSAWGGDIRNMSSCCCIDVHSSQPSRPCLLLGVPERCCRWVWRRCRTRLCTMLRCCPIGVRSIVCSDWMECIHNVLRIRTSCVCRCSYLHVLRNMPCGCNQALLTLCPLGKEELLRSFEKRSALLSVCSWKLSTHGGCILAAQARTGSRVYNTYVGNKQNVKVLCVAVSRLARRRALSIAPLRDSDFHLPSAHDVYIKPYTSCTTTRVISRV